MKKFVLLFVICLAQITSYAQEGVNFRPLTFDKALETAKSENRLLFIDCYTSWCGPCKNMLKNVFTRKDVGDFINEKFVAVKFDMEKGEGPALMKKFRVAAFPTFLILNPDGSVYHKIVGGAAPADFIKKLSVGPDKAIGLLEAKYNAGNRDKAFLRNYVDCLEESHSYSSHKIAAELFNRLSEEEKTSADYWFLFQIRNVMSRQVGMVDYLIRHREQYYKTVGVEEVDRLLGVKYRRYLKPSLIIKKKISTEKLEELKKEISGLDLSNGRTLLSNINIAQALLKGGLSDIISTCSKEIRHISSEDFMYYTLINDMVASKGNAKEKAQWIKVSRKLQSKAKNTSLKKRIGMNIERL